MEEKLALADSVYLELYDMSDNNRMRKARLCVCVCSCHTPTSFLLCIFSLVCLWVQHTSSDLRSHTKGALCWCC